MATFKNYSLVAHKNFAEQRDGGSGDSYGSTFTDGGIGSAVKGAAAGLGAGAATYLAGGVAQGLKDTAIGKPVNHESIQRLLRESASAEDIANAISGTSSNPRVLEQSLGDLFRYGAAKPNMVNQVLQKIETSHNNLLDATGYGMINQGRHAGSHSWFTSFLPGAGSDDMPKLVENWSEYTKGLKLDTKLGFVNQMESAITNMGNHPNTTKFVEELATKIKNGDQGALEIFTGLFAKDQNSALGQRILNKLDNDPQAINNIRNFIANNSLKLDRNPLINVTNGLENSGIRDAKLDTTAWASQATKKNKNPQAQQILYQQAVANSAKNINDATKYMQITQPNNWDEIKNKTLVNKDGRAIGSVGEMETNLKRMQINEILAQAKSSNSTDAGIKIINGHANIDDASKFATWFNNNKDNITFSGELTALLQDFKNLDNKDYGVVGRLFGKIRNKFAKGGYTPPTLPTNIHVGSPGRVRGTQNKPGDNISERLRLSGSGGKKKLAAVVGLATMAAVGLTQYWNRFSDALHDSLKSIGRKCIFEYDSKYFKSGAKFANTETALRKYLNDNLKAYYQKKPKVFEDADIISTKVGKSEPKYVSAQVCVFKNSNGSIKNCALALKVCYLTDVELKYQYTQANDDNASGDEDSLDTVSADVVMGLFLLNNKSDITFKDLAENLSYVKRSKIDKFTPKWKFIKYKTAPNFAPAANAFNGGTDFTFHETVEDYTGTPITSPLRYLGFPKAQPVDSSANAIYANYLFTKDDALS